MKEQLLCFTTTILSVKEAQKRQKNESKIYKLNHAWLYTKSLNAVSSTHPTYDDELLRPLDHQTEDPGLWVRWGKWNVEKAGQL